MDLEYTLVQWRLHVMTATSKIQWPGKVPGHWGYCQYFKFSKGHWAFGKVPVTWESPGPLRLLLIFQIFKRTLGLWDSPSGLGHWGYCQYFKFLKGHWAFGKVPVAWESPRPLRLLPIFQIFKSTLGLCESASGLRVSQTTEAIVNTTNIQKYTGP